MSVRARLLVLALVAVVPLMIDRAWQIELDRAKQIEAVSQEARALVRQGTDAQHETIVAVKSVVQVVARAHATLVSSPESCARFLSGATSDAPWITGLSVIGANGRIVCSTAQNSVGLDVSERPYVQEALRGKDFIVSAQAVGRSRGAVGLVAAMPILDDGNGASGIIAAGFELQWIDRLAAEVARRPGAMLLLVENSGTLLSAQPGDPKWLRKKLEAPALLAVIGARDNGIATVAGPDGVRRSFGYARLANTDTFLAVGLDEADILHRVDREMRLAYLKFVLVGAFVLFGVWFGGEQMIVRPLRALARMAVHVGHGNLQIRTARRWAAEFAPLAGALNAMALRLAEHEEELRVANAHLDRLARLDSLSGLANRRGFDAALDAKWRESEQALAPLAMIMIDVDHFKAFNDRYGHVAGDMCLRTVAEAIAKAARGAAIVARYGGEEFALLFPGTGIERALGIGEELRAAIEHLTLTHQGAPVGHVTVSVGVASVQAANGEAARVLVEAADAALYEAKRRGRNTVVGHSAIRRLANA